MDYIMSYVYKDKGSTMALQDSITLSYKPSGKKIQDQLLRGKHPEAYAFEVTSIDAVGKAYEGPKSNYLFDACYWNEQKACYAPHVLTKAFNHTPTKFDLNKMQVDIQEALGYNVSISGFTKLGD